MKLNIGCGPYHADKYINIDINPQAKPDLICDVRKGLPFDANSCDEVRAFHFLEHLNNDELLFLLDDCFRVLINGGILDIMVPVGVTGVLDHKMIFLDDSFDLLCRDQIGSYFNKRFAFDLEHKSCYNEILSGKTIRILRITLKAKKDDKPIIENPNKEKLFLQSESVVNDEVLLAKIKGTCHTLQDSRACWVGAGIPSTLVKQFVPFSNWALQHWAMYAGFLDSIKKDNISRNVLDVGCGSGHASVCLASIYQNWAISAIDMDSVCLNFAKTYNSAHNLKYIEADFLKLDFNTKYDYIFALEILEHIAVESHYLMIDKCLSLLADDGLLFLTTPNCNDDNSNIGKTKAGGHIGVLNYDLSPKFYAKYRKNIVTAGFYDNEQLISCDIKRFTIDEPFEKYKDNDRNRSHFKFILKRVSV